MDKLDYSNLCKMNFEANLEELTGRSDETCIFYYGLLSKHEYDFIKYPDCVTRLHDKTIGDFKKLCEAGDYKKATALCIAINYKSWAFDANVDPSWLGCNENQRIDVEQCYIDMYYETRDLFYETFGGNEAATDWFFEQTD